MFTQTIKGLAFSLLLTAVSAVSIAEDHLYLGSTIGLMVWDDERFLNNDEDSGVTAGLNLGYEFVERFAIEGRIGANLSGPDANMYGVTFYDFLSASREGITPYWLAGLNYVDMDERSVLRVTESLSAHVGLGVSNYISDNLEFRGDLRVSKALDTGGNIGGNIGNLVDDPVDYGINLALNYHLGDRSKPAKPVKPARAIPATVPAAPTAPTEEPATPKTRMVRVTIAVFFNTDEDVAIGYGDDLDKIARAMKDHPALHLTLEGHTDSRGETAYNQNLSERRANTVAAKLVNDYQISASRIETIGYGEERPVADNTSAEGRAKNRRVVGVISWEEIVR